MTVRADISPWGQRPRTVCSGVPAVVAGRGPQVLLLHGVGLRAEAWAAQIDALSDRARVVAPDMAGHGAAPRLDRPGLAAYAAFAGRCLTEPSVIVGHSMGAMLAFDLAARHPDMVRGVVALNAIYRRSELAKEAVQARAAALDGTSPVDPAAPIARWFGNSKSAAQHACATWLRATDPPGYRDAYTVFAQEDGPDALHTLTRPSLFMTGTDDANSTPAMSCAMADAANSRAVIIDDAGHMMPMTHAADVNAHLLPFISHCLHR